MMTMSVCVCMCTYVHMLACIFLYVSRSEDKEVMGMGEKRDRKISHYVLEIVLGHSDHLIFHLSFRIHLLSIH